MRIGHRVGGVDFVCAGGPGGQGGDFAGLENPPLKVLIQDLANPKRDKSN